VRLRFIRVDKPAALADDADDAAKKAHSEQLAAARKKAEQALSRLGAGDAFPVVAREFSDDANTKRGGGDYGWASVDGTGSGLEGIVDQTATKLEDGQSSDIVEGDEAFWIVRVEGHREGDVPKEDALREIAFESVRKDAGREQARQAAQEALLRVKEGEKFEDVFGTKKVEPSGIESLPMGEFGELGNPSAEAPGGPEVAVTGLFSKGKPVPGLGPHAELQDAAWAAADGAVIDRVFEIEDGFVIASVDEKRSATDDGFAAARTELFRELTESKGGKLAAVLAHRRCLEAKGRGAIKPNAAEVKQVMTYSTKEAFDEEGNRVIRPYSMCDRVGNRGGLLRAPAAFAGGR
jgi:parvulin-like peptidyl-prolyl isomerase